MRVLVFEPQYVGHNLAYVRHLTTGLRDLGCEVHLLTSKQAVESEEFASHLGTVAPSLRITAMDSFSTRPKSGAIRVNGPTGLFGMLRSLHRGLCNIEPDHVFIPFGNPLAHCCGFPNPVSRWLTKNRVETELVLLSGKYAYPHSDLRSRIKEWLALAILARGPWTRVHHIVPHAVEVMKRHRSRLSSIASLLPDPVETAPDMDRMQARRILDLPSGGRIVSLVGLLERRKGVRELLQAFQLAGDQLRPDDRLLLAGKATDEIRSLLRNSYASQIDAGRIICLDRHLSSHELWAACIAANLICTPYPYHLFSASIVIRAAQVSVPVLANSIGWMEQTINRFALGTTCNTNSPEIFSRHLATSLNAFSEYQPDALARRFVDFHTPENFALRLTDRVAERMGVRNHRTGVHWNDVVRSPSDQAVPVPDTALAY